MNPSLTTIAGFTGLETSWVINELGIKTSFEDVHFESINVFRLNILKQAMGNNHWTLITQCT